MGIAVKRILPVLAAGAAGLAISTAVAAFSSAPMAAGQPTEPTPVTTTVTVMAPPSGPPDGMACTSSATSTKCQKHGDAEINAAIPAPYPGIYGVYGPFWGGSAG